MSHIRNKEQKDKEKAQDNAEPCFLAACFDLEQILLTPSSFESSVYYKRKLNSYNFTVYNLGNADGRCYLWNESIAGRGRK